MVDERSAYTDYLERMNTHTYEIVDGKAVVLAYERYLAHTLVAALRHPHVQVDVWGPGWSGYNDLLPLSVNVRRRQHRLVQLVKARRDFEERIVLQHVEYAKKRRKRERWEWWTSWITRKRRLSPLELIKEAEESIEKWVDPEWEDAPAICGDKCFDLVWTISYVSLDRIGYLSDIREKRYLQAI